jgi:Tol biopolymer transport system component
VYEDETGKCLDESSAGLYLLSVDSGQKRLIDRRGGGAVWSPDGKHLLYTQERGALDVLVVVNQDLSDPTEIPTEVKGSFVHAAWMPDSKKIIFRPFDLRSLQVFDIKSRTETQFEGESIPLWSPDGTRYIQFDPKDGWVIKKKDGTVEHTMEGLYKNGSVGLTNNLLISENKNSLGREFSWAPDSKHFVFSNAYSGDSVVVVDVETGGSKVIAKGLRSAWSPR